MRDSSTSGSTRRKWATPDFIILREQGFDDLTLDRNTRLFLKLTEQLGSRHRLTQTFSYTVSNNNAGLFAVGPAIDASGTLTYTLNPNVSGAAAVTVSVRDDGGTAGIPRVTSLPPPSSPRTPTSPCASSAMERSRT